MRTFVLRARAAPTDSQKLLASVGQDAHPEILAHTLMNAIFVAQSHRADVVVYLVLESTADFSRSIRFEANAMHEIDGFDERALPAADGELITPTEFFLDIRPSQPTDAPAAASSGRKPRNAS